MAAPARWRGPRGKTRFVIVQREHLEAAFPKWKDHEAFIRALQEQKDFVVWCTRNMSGTPNNFLPDLDMVAGCWNVVETMRVCEERWPEITEGVVVGDTKDMIVAVQEHNKAEDTPFPWAFLLTKKLETLLDHRP